MSCCNPVFALPGGRIEPGRYALSETIFKLQPDRTVHLRGFDTFAAAAAVHSASPAGFSATGTFRDPADFTVAVLYDADNFFEHPHLRYLPDFDFDGLTLSFDLHYSARMQPIDSPKYNWIDWATLDCIRADGTASKVSLWDNATLASGSFTPASATVNVTTSGGVQAFDRTTLWFQNLAFDYIAPDGHSSAEFAFFAKGKGTTHSITVNGRTYSHTEVVAAGESSADQASALIAAVGSDPDVSAGTGSAPHIVRLTVRSSRSGVDIPVSASDGNASLNMRLTTPEIAASDLTSQINGTNWVSANPTHGLMAAVSGAQITLTAARYGTVSTNGTHVTFVGGTRFAGLVAGNVIRINGGAFTVASVQSPTALTLNASAGIQTGVPYLAPRGGVDGNLLTLYTIHKTGSLLLDQAEIHLSGGSSNVTWNCRFDFTALGLTSLRQLWLTFAPALQNSAFTGVEWAAVFSNWSVTGPDSKRLLKVAGPGSVRLEETNPSCRYTGTWTVESGFYSRYFAKATSDSAATLTVTYSCQSVHDLYVGTSLYVDRAKAGVRLDGDAETELNCVLGTGSAVVARRRVRSGVAAGRHTVTFRIVEAGVFYFDFLEAAVLSDIPAALTARPGISPALDFDTDHTYKLPPARLMWSMDQLGYAGPMNEYLGVFWWNERTLAGGSLSTARVDFSGTFAAGDTVFLTLNGSSLGKAVFPADTPATIAGHFAFWINGAFVGARAEASGGTLTLYGRSPAPAYTVAVSVSTASTTGAATVTVAPVAGVYGTWMVDTAANPPLNRAARDWHTDFYGLCAARSREVTTACSMELVYPPASFVARYPDTARTPVSTATGFGSLASTHCALGNSGMLAYQKAVYRALAALQSTAGLVPNLQFGEFLWWFFAGPSGMGFYDDETLAAATTALGRSLHIFSSSDDDPTVNSSADAIFLRNRLRDHMASLTADIRSAYPTAKLELLWPYDVNYPVPVPVDAPYLGGRLNRFINLPVEWQDKSTSGLDRVKVEALAFASGMRNLDLAAEAINLFPDFGWPRDSVRYLIPVFGAATPWHRELALALGAGLTVNNLWAFDHVCLFNLDVPEKGLDRRSLLLAA